MHSFQSYLQGLPTPVLKGGLSGWCDGLASYVDEAVLLMVEILRSRGELDPETEEAVAQRLEALRKAREEKKQADSGNTHGLWIFRAPGSDTSRD